MINEQLEVQCTYKYCVHENKTVDINTAIKKRGKYYHPECIKDQENRKEIIDLFVNYINPNPVYKELQRVINTIILRKHIDSDFLLFGLKFYIKHKIPLNYPQGLYYVIQNKDVITAYNKALVSTLNKNSFSINETSNSDFQYTPRKEKTVADIVNN